MGTPIEGGEVQGGAVEGGGETPGLNPAWTEALSAIPEQFHQTLTPHFQQWDQSAQQRIEQANSQVKTFEGFQPFIDSGISPQDLEQAAQLAYMVQTDPQAVYNALQEAHGFGSGETVSQEGEGEEEDPNAIQDPRFEQFVQQQQQMQQGLDLVAQTILQQEQAKVAQAADSKLDAEINELKQKYPHFDENYFLSLMAQGASTEDASKAYAQLTQNILQQNPRPFAPTVMGNSGGGTGLPSQAIDPTKLGDKERRALVAQMVQQQLNS
jgi:hypothetical protein